MAWEWSHTIEAYQDARAQVENQDREWLEECFAEWHAKADPSEVAGGFSESQYTAALRKSRGLPDDVLVDFIWERMEKQRTCTNGGWEAWACPFGCHAVPFEPVDSAEK